MLERAAARASGATVFGYYVSDPERYGVVDFDEAGRAIGIEEKPKKPKSKYAVTGVYMYDEQVWKMIKTLKPSGRGELEITDVNNYYVKQGTLTYDILDGFWTDAGTFESLLRANNLVAETRSLH